MKGIVFFLLLLTTLTAGGLLYFYDPGFVEITWLGYEAQFTVVVGIVLFLFLLLIFILFIRVFLWLIGMPLRWFSFFKRSQQKKAKNELLELLCSFEGDNLIEALHHQKKAAPHLSKDPFFLWVSGNTYEKAEQPLEAEKHYMALTTQPSTAFLGLKGQTRAALHRRDFKLAYTLLCQMDKLMPTSRWVLKHLLALTREKKDFKEAEDLVLRLEDLGYFSSAQSTKQIAHLQYQQAIQPDISQTQKEALVRQANYLDPSLKEAAELFAQILKDQGHKAHALNVLEATWQLAPAQKLGDLYLVISEPSDEVTAYQVAEKLVKKNKENSESLLFLSRIALKAKLWGEARSHLMQLLKQNPSPEAYGLFASLELEEHHNWQAALKWLEDGLQFSQHIS